MRALLVIITATLIAGCTSTTPSTTLEGHYNKIIDLISPGMTRRQLYALLPPAQTPYGYIKRTAVRLRYSEYHPLDEQLHIYIEYDISKKQKKFESLFIAGTPAPQTLSLETRRITSQQNPNDLIQSLTKAISSSPPE